MSRNNTSQPITVTSKHPAQQADGGFVGYTATLLDTIAGLSAQLKQVILSDVLLESTIFP